MVRFQLRFIFNILVLDGTRKINKMKKSCLDSEKNWFHYALCRDHTVENGTVRLGTRYCMGSVTSLDTLLYI